MAKNIYKHFNEDDMEKVNFIKKEIYEELAKNPLPKDIAENLEINIGIKKEKYHTDVFLEAVMDVGGVEKRVAYHDYWSYKYIPLEYEKVSGLDKYIGEFLDDCRNIKITDVEKTSGYYEYAATQNAIKIEGKRATFYGDDYEHKYHDVKDKFKENIFAAGEIKEEAFADVLKYERRKTQMDEIKQKWLDHREAKSEERLNAEEAIKEKAKEILLAELKEQPIEGGNTKITIGRDENDKVVFEARYEFETGDDYAGYHFWDFMIALLEFEDEIELKLDGSLSDKAIDKMVEEKVKEFVGKCEYDDSIKSESRVKRECVMTSGLRSIYEDYEKINNDGTVDEKENDRYELPRFNEQDDIQNDNEIKVEYKNKKDGGDDDGEQGAGVELTPSTYDEDDDWKNAAESDAVM